MATGVLVSWYVFGAVRDVLGVCMLAYSCGRQMPGSMAPSAHAYTAQTDELDPHQDVCTPDVIAGGRLKLLPLTVRRA